MSATVDGITAPLDDAERLQLHDLEETVRTGLSTFLKVGRALAAIRDGHLYRESHGTFESYLAEKWPISRTHAYRLISAAQAVVAIEAVSPRGDVPLPTSEKVARQIVGLPATVAAKVLTAAGENATASKVRKVRETVTAEASAETKDVAPQRKAIVPSKVRKSLPEGFEAGKWSALADLEGLLRLTTDDRFAGHRADLKHRHLGDLRRMRQQLAQVIAALEVGGGA